MSVYHFTFKDDEAEKKWKEGYKKQKSKNSKAVYEIAGRWASLMEKSILKGKKLKTFADRTFDKADEKGQSSGFTYGAAIQLLCECWQYGDDLRKWHNKEWGGNEDDEGVIDPVHA